MSIVQDMTEQAKKQHLLDLCHCQACCKELVLVFRAHDGGRHWDEWEHEATEQITDDGMDIDLSRVSRCYCPGCGLIYDPYVRFRGAGIATEGC